MCPGCLVAGGCRTNALPCIICHCYVSCICICIIHDDDGLFMAAWFVFFGRGRLIGLSLPLSSKEVSDGSLPLTLVSLGFAFHAGCLLQGKVQSCEAIEQAVGRSCKLFICRSIFYVIVTEIHSSAPRRLLTI